MKQGKKIALTTASALVFAGLVLSVSSMCAMDFDFSKLETTPLHSETIQVEQSFTNISMTGTSCDIQFLPAPDDSCTVTCSLRQGNRCEAQVQDGTLYIRQWEEQKWYLGISLHPEEIRVYLPEDSYASIQAETNSGDLTISEPLQFQSANLQSNSGSIDLSASISGKLSMTAQSGDIRAKDTRLHQLEARCNSGSILLEQVILEADAQLHANNGSIILTNVQGGTLSADAGSGDVRLTNVLTEDSLRLETNSGNIKLQHSDGAAITIRSGSGDVSGSLRTPKQFVTQTGSGSCSVPESGTGGACEIRTNSGDIRLKVEE